MQHLHSHFIFCSVFLTHRPLPFQAHDPVAKIIINLRTESRDADKIIITSKQNFNPGRQPKCNPANRRFTPERETSENSTQQTVARSCKKKKNGRNNSPSPSAIASFPNLQTSLFRSAIASLRSFILTKTGRSDDCHCQKSAESSRSHHP